MKRLKDKLADRYVETNAYWLNAESQFDVKIAYVIAFTKAKDMAIEYLRHFEVPEYEPLIKDLEMMGELWE